LGVTYAELVCCSNFSFLRGASHPFELVKRAKEAGYAALAITDECSLAGVVRAHEVAKEVGLQLLIGSQFRFPEGDRLVLLAPDHDAYSEISALITQGRRASSKGTYKLGRGDFVRAKHCIGLWLPGAGVDRVAAEWFAALPLARSAIGFTHDLSQDSDRRLDQMCVVGNRLGLELVAAGDVHYHARDRRRLHDVLTATRNKTTVDRIGRAGFANGERHLRPLATLRKLYPEDLLARTADIASQCQFSLSQLHYEYPHELVPEGETAMSHLRALTEAGIRRRWPAGIELKVREQIERELVLIADLQYEHYFLTVADIVTFARSQGILCQGRGSAANSAVCYVLGVTEVDPARVSMLFERFISKERAEPPDIDVDFEHQRREDVIQYIYRKYGRERAALAATVICYRWRMAVRDVGKALGLPLDLVDALSKNLHWFEGKNALLTQLQALGFDPKARVVGHLIVLVKELLGFPRHLSQHVGGFVISQHPLHTLVPVENAAMPDRTIIQWDKEDLEALGLLKVDCLALGMLSAIRRALEMVGKFEGREFRMQDVPAEDPATYEMLGRGESVGVFQVESRAQMSMLPRLKPKNYYDLVIEVAIIRPGPIQGGMVHPYLRRRQGIEPVEYPSPDLEKVLSRTLGVPLFQEQVMQIAMVAAGFSAGEADLVRRSMAAWQRRGGLEHFRDKLYHGMLSRGYEPEFAERIFNQVLGFGSYGFPESHSASFALLVYVSAWLRCWRPAAFVAGLLNSWPMGFYAPAQLVADARRNGVAFRDADVQYSEWDCTLERGAGIKPDVRLGLRMVKGLAETQAQDIVAARSTAPFDSVDDLAHRARLNRRNLDLLARANALQSIAGHRRLARWGALGVERLPGMLAGTSAHESAIELAAPSEGQDIVADFRSMGLTLGRHPLELLRTRLKRLGVRRAADLNQTPNGSRVRVAGIVTHRQRPETASGVVFISLEDESGISNLIIWPRTLEQQRLPVLGARLMVVEGQLQSEQGVIHVVAQRIRDYSAWLGALDAPSRDFR
jgi:error-prone DNA polymerase